MSDPRTEAILDATRSTVLDFGVRRATLSDVARRAGVSRTTVYRRYPDVQALLADLMSREFGQLMGDAGHLMDEVGEEVDGSDARARVVARLLACVSALRKHSVLRRVLEVEPELLLPYMLGRIGQTQRHALVLIERDIEAGQRDGSIRAGDATVIARLLLGFAQSFVFSTALEADREVGPLLDELAHVIDCSLSTSSALAQGSSAGNAERPWL